MISCVSVSVFVFVSVARLECVWIGDELVGWLVDHLAWNSRSWTGLDSGTSMLSVCVSVYLTICLIVLFVCGLDCAKYDGGSKLEESCCLSILDFKYCVVGITRYE